MGTSLIAARWHFLRFLGVLWVMANFHRVVYGLGSIIIAFLRWGSGIGNTKKESLVILYNDEEMVVHEINRFDYEIKETVHDRGDLF